MTEQGSLREYKIGPTFENDPCNPINWKPQ